MVSTNKRSGPLNSFQLVVIVIIILEIESIDRNLIFTSLLYTAPFLRAVSSADERKNATLMRFVDNKQKMLETARFDCRI